MQDHRPADIGKAYRFALLGKPGEQSFMRAYEDAAAKFESGLPINPARPRAGTWDALVVSYYRSAEFQSLRDRSKNL